MRSCVTVLASAPGALLGACAIEDQSVIAVVDLTVRRVPGTPVPGASVHVQVVDTVDGELMIDEPMGITDPSGQFRRILGVFLAPPFPGRVTLTVRPAVASGLPDTTLVAGVVMFALDQRTPDTARVAVEYP